MKIAILADIHGNLVAFRAVLEAARKRNPSRFIVAGDIVGYGPRPNEVIELVYEIGALAIRGNHDQAIINCDYSYMNPYAAEAAKWTAGVLSAKNLNRLRSMKRTEVLEVEKRRIGVYHGSPEHPDEYVLDEHRAEQLLDWSDCDIVICGHTHIPMEVSLRDKIFLNPGSVGQPRDGNPCASFMELDLGSMRATLHRVEYSIEITQEEMALHGLPKLLIDRLSNGQ